MKWTRGDILFGSLVTWCVIATGLTLRLEYRRDSATSPSEAGPRAVAVPQWQRMSLRGYSVGPDHAPVTVVVFSDFECPYCRRFAETIDSLHQGHPEVHIVERHFPLEIHFAAFDAALAAECALDFGRYQVTRHILFSRRTLVDEERWGEVARAAGIRDTVAFNRCVGQRRHEDAVQADIAAAKSIGVSATPSVLVNDTMYTGTLSLADLSAKVNLPIVAADGRRDP